MAYTEDGQYYFDPELDVDDKEALDSAARIEQALAYRQTQRAQAQVTAAQQQAWDQALREAGLDQATYNQLHAADPLGTQELISQSMKAVAKAVASRKGKTQPRLAAKTGKPVQRQQAQPKSSEKLEAAEEIVKKRSLTSDEELSVLDDVLGPDFSFYD